MTIVVTAATRGKEGLTPAQHASLNKLAIALLADATCLNCGKRGDTHDAPARRHCRKTWRATQ